jgi:acyl transferase domain-containing protein
LKEDIVIVGQAVRLSGDINNAESLWKALIDQRDDIMTPIPEAWWDHKSFNSSPDSKNPSATCDITLDKAEFVELAGFDHSFFGISSAEAFRVSPNIPLSMEIAFKALENANIPISKIKGSDMGVFVAAGMDEGYIKLLFADKGWGGLCLPFRVLTHVIWHSLLKLIPDSMEPVLLQARLVVGSASE